MLSTHFFILLQKSNWSLLLSCGPAGLSVVALSLQSLAPTSAGGKEKCATQYGIFSSFCPGPDLFGPDPLSISALAFISYIAPLLLK